MMPQPGRVFVDGKLVLNQTLESMEVQLVQRESRVGRGHPSVAA
jgi:hypothetical protein